MGRGAPPDSTSGQSQGPGSAAKQMAASQAKERVPYADKADMGKKVLDAHQQGGLGAGLEEAAGQGGAAAARAGASTVTGGLSDAAGAAAPGVTKAIDKAGEAAGKGAYKAVGMVAAAAVSVIVGIVILLSGGLTSIVAAVTGNTDVAPAPTTEQCESMPLGWCDVVYQGQQATHTQTVPVPWTVLAGVARVATDFGRTSPYDFTDRDPLRETPPYLAANFSEADTAGSANGGTVPYNSGSLAWGGHSNGAIPLSALCDVPWAPGYKLECGANDALTALNEKYKAEHGGASLTVNSGYRDMAGQIYQRDRWCAKGSCQNAAKPGTSNHGWALAVDLGSFGTIGDYSSANYKWMMANGPAFGWHHPPAMQAGGKGPLEPWHWEYRGVDTAAGAATTAQTSSASKSWSVSTGLGEGVSAAGSTTNGCFVENSTTAIGGEGRQAVGPFLLLPAAAQNMRDAGTDPNNPCQAAEFVARELAQAAAEVRAEDGPPEFGDQEAGSAYWQKVIKVAGIIADPDNPAGECTVANEEMPIDQMIDEIWSCELTQAPELHVASGPSVSTMAQVSFKEYDRATAQATLIAEAKSVAWASSQYGAAQCSETAETAGVFPLTADAASEVGVVERCDVRQNILAAAQLVISGEAVPLTDRAPRPGPYSPMVGGWAKIPAALGTDGSGFAWAGPYRSWEPSAQCAAVIDAYVVHAARDGSPFTALANASARPAETATYSDFVGPWPGDTAALCSGASDYDLAAQAVVAAQAHLTDQSGVVVNRDDEPTEQDSAPVEGHVDADLEDGDTDGSQGTGDLDELLDIDGALSGGGGGGFGFSAPLVTADDPATPDPQALLGLAAWFNWKAQEAPAAAGAVFGTNSVVPRLSLTGNPAPIGPVTSSLVFSATAWQTRATEWAVFYGGVVRPYDTHGERTGSLVSSLTGVAGQYVAVSGDAEAQATQIIEAAKLYLGTPYSWGGGGKSGPSTGTTGIVGFDCSGLTEYAFAQAGYDIGGWTGLQKDQGTVVASLAEAKAGDLLFFGAPIRHVAIYMGNNQLIHAPKPGDVVKIVDVYETPILIKRVIVARETTGGLDGWVNSALSTLYANGFPQGANDAQHLKTIIDHESSGNPEAVNKSDSNWVAGHPSFGLMQTIPSTFEAYALPGFTDKADPVAQIIAGARYAQKRYGGLDKVPGIVAVANGQPYVGY